ncbi:MAG: ATP-binding protein [Actinomycetota bacterium]
MNREARQYKSTLRKLNVLYQISRYVSSTLNLENVLRTILTGVTFGNGFGFNRAYLFLADKRGEYLAGRMAVGPASEEDAARIWNQIREENYSLEGFLNAKSREQRHTPSRLDAEVKSIKIPIKSECLIAAAFRKRRVVNVDLEADDFKGRAVEPQINALIDYPRFCVIPMASFGRTMGVMIVDNKYNRRDITSDDISFLLMLSQQATLAIENANAYYDLKKIVNRLVKINQKINYLKEYNENILENIPIGICVVDTAYNINACNSSFSLMAGKKKAELIGRPISFINLKVKGKNIKRFLRKVMHVQKNRSFERTDYRFGQKSGICNLNLALFKVGGGKIDGIIVIIDDITEKARMEETLKEFKRLAQLGELAAQVAHEIRNPLVAIGGYARRLKRRYTAEQEIEAGDLNIIADEVQRLETILSSTLQFSSKRKTAKEHIELLEVLRECIQVVSAYAEDKNTDLSFDIGPGVNYIGVRGSAQQLKQAFINLIKNSIEASYGGEAVKISVARARGMAVIRIENRGSIIEKKDIEKIFLPFYSTKKEGTGLGLAITKKIVLEHEGKIDVYSKKGNTVFTIKLPLGGENEKDTDS